MTVNLLKMAVGIEDVPHLARVQQQRREAARDRGQAPVARHVTRMTPRRTEDVLDGGSIYWVIRGFVQVRQRLVDVRPIVDREGVPRCHFVLEPKLVATVPQPCRPFQGWRYLEPKHVPADLAGASTGDELPPHIWRELAELGLL